MALVIATQEYISLPINLVMFCAGLIMFLIMLIIVLSLRMRKFQKIADLKTNQLNQIFSQNNPLKTLVATSVNRQRQAPNPKHTSHSKTQTRLYQQPLNTRIHTQINPQRLTKQSLRVKKSRRLLLLAIMLAIVTGTAIALIQFGNVFISSEYYLHVGMGLGFLILIGAISAR